MVEVGISLGISPREPISHTVEVVRQAEELGFHSAWIPDVQLSMKDCFAALALCAANTSRIRLGTGVTNPVTRHPTTIASAFSAIQEISGGRAVLGIGSGWTAVYSIGMKPASIAELERDILLIKGLLMGEEVTMDDGRRIRLLTTQGAIPIFLAANQPRILRLAGRVADGVILMGGASRQFTDWQMNHVRAGADEAGRRLEDISLHLWAAISISDDEPQALDDVRPWVAAQAETFSRWRQLPDFLMPYHEDFKRVSQAYDRLDHLSQHAPHKRSVSDDLVRFLAIVGTQEECRERIRNLTELGLDGITLSFRAGGRHARMITLADAIIRPLKEGALHG